MLDPIPASDLKNCYDLLLMFITKVVNCSLQNYTLTSDMKRAIVRPYVKKKPLDYQLYKNHRPISNLMFLSKCCEKVAANQFISHLRENKLEEIFQSSYKVSHSTESALLRVHNDVLCTLDDGRCVMLVLSDLQQRSIQWIMESYYCVSPSALVFKALPTLGLSLTRPVVHSSSKSKLLVLLIVD